MYNELLEICRENGLHPHCVSKDARALAARMGYFYKNGAEVDHGRASKDIRLAVAMGIIVVGKSASYGRHLAATYILRGQGETMEEALQDGILH